MSETPHGRRTSLNVRGDLVGHDEAEELELDDDRTTALATTVLGGCQATESSRRPSTER